MADQTASPTPCAHRRSIWDITTPEEVVDVLTEICGQAAGIEALLRYDRTSTDGFDCKTFWSEVLNILGASELRDVPVTPRSIAALLFKHCPRPHSFAISYIHEAHLEENIAQAKFWLQVLAFMDRQ